MTTTPTKPTPVAEGVPHLSQEDLAAKWKISTGTLERWRCERIGPPFLKLHGKVRYRACDVEAFEESRLRKTSSQS